ncbi:helix-turn-helix domain-containing protein [Streptosporangium pseudovulgare]|uniref:DNA-binding protein n=1 Tax=Streptosporangium pseudovulgare TaxID=35765 RepID=A0ABQ2QLU9_9ACTN|nr:helix-turn-helix domain-containing protein [Streptosporangium pseudovulgare]GGP84407.1 DNA-binding protein [Streptosporangium pseudovulgare]
MRIHRSKRSAFFTVIGNEVLRDRRLSLTARGLLAYLLSLPDGTRQDIRTLAAENSEGKTAIAAAMRELIQHGYMTRNRVRSDTGRVSTVVDVYDTPQTGENAEFPQVAPKPDAPDTGEPNTGASGTTPKGVKNQEKETNPPAVETSEAQKPADTTGKGGEEASPDNDEMAACAALMGRLGRVEPRLTIGRRDLAKVAPLVAEWLDRGATETQIRTVLTTALPDELRSPVALIIHRLRDKMPARVAAAPKAAKAASAECDDCARPVPAPGRCPQCVTGSTRKPGPIADVARHVAMARELLTRRAVPLAA